jgi:hypothetical protein
MAGGVNLVLIDGRNLASHRAWILLFAVGSIGAAVWYAVAAYRSGQWLGGASAPGLTFGIAAGLLILFEFSLWPRKKVRVWRIGRAQTWMRAHIWLGLLTVPLAVLHSGFRLGGALPTVLMVLFAIVIASGLFGLWMQQIIPRMMLEQAPGETIYSQINRVARQLVHEADAIVAACCEPSQGEAPAGRTVQVAAVAESYQEGGRDFRPWQVKLLERELPVRPTPNTAALGAFHHDELRPYLLTGSAANPVLAAAARAAQVFDALRRKSELSVTSVIDALERLCDQRRDLDVQARLHKWLHAWLWAHLPLSAALVLLMLVHAFAALRYW